MRGFGFLLLLVLAASTCAASSAGPNPTGANLDLAASCSICHADITSQRSAIADIHASLGCDSCHPGRTFNPHVSPTLDLNTQKQPERFARVADRSAAAYTQCENCHADAVAAWRDSIHGPRPGDSADVKKPNCSGCHGSIHNVTKESQSKIKLAANCMRCHSFSEDEPGANTPFVVNTYRDTIHGKMVALGNAEAAACADCHTGHHVFPRVDPRSSVNLVNRVKTCGKCHKNATPAFVEAISHKPYTLSGNFWAGLTAIAFSALTLGVIAALFVHVLLDFLRTGQRTWLRPHITRHSAEGRVRADAEVQRFDIQMRLQHWGMMAAVVLLLLTGWPLKAARVRASVQFAEALGGQHVLALVHRAAAVMLIAVAIYHLIYLAVLYKRGRLPFSMVPRVKDFSDAFRNLVYFLGLKNERPQFDRYTYYEKFDYWMAICGVTVMASSGLILWLPVLASRLVPAEVIALSDIVHSEGALLALLAIFLWHLYNTHLRPTVFPMSRVWLTGRISVEALYEEHRAEYQRLFGDAPPAAPTLKRSWQERPIWAYSAIALPMIAGLSVVVTNFSAVREQIAALSGEQIGAARGHRAANAPVPSVYDARFDVFTKCFACHAREGFESGDRGFPHRKHLNEIQIDAKCNDCHVGTWHKKMQVKTEMCLGCHKPEAIELGKPAK